MHLFIFILSLTKQFEKRKKNYLSLFGMENLVFQARRNVFIFWLEN